MVAARLANLTHGGDRRADQAAKLPLEEDDAPDLLLGDGATGIEDANWNEVFEQAGEPGEYPGWCVSWKPARGGCKFAATC
jgi:hypothetical protein